ncbi:MAG: DUF4347 domain-containing protein, partial [Gammaproteobacteria bacterium]|nr:DUF4347 domain-containing protein [Gammaproteobacteria bacterium]
MFSKRFASPRRRPLLLQTLEERILWDATLAPDPEPEPATEDAPVATLADAPIVETDAATAAPVAAVPTETPVGPNGAPPLSEQLPQDPPGEAEPIFSETPPAPTPSLDAGVHEVSSPEDSGSSDATAAADVAEDSALSDQAALTATGDSGAQSTLEDAGASDVPAAADGERENTTAQELIIVDASVNDYQRLVDDIRVARQDTAKHSAAPATGEPTRAPADPTNVEIIVLDGDRAGVEQVTDLLTGYDGLQALHIVSHGDDARLYLGGDVISNDSLTQYDHVLRQWGEALSESGDILIYGCEVAQTAEGEMLVERIAELTGADVAASTDDTGSDVYRGDWELEYAAGNIEARTALTAGQTQWLGLLAPPEPVTSLTLPGVEKLNHFFDMTFTFDNTAGMPDEIGYGPYMDVVIEAGIDVDGAGGMIGVPTSASGPVGFTAYDWNGTLWDQLDTAGNLTGLTINPLLDDHPFDSTGGFLPVPGGSQVGDRWYVLELPFGSFTPDQPAFAINLVGQLSAADGATPGSALDVSARGGFRYGADPLDNAPGDPQVFEAAANTASITPELFMLTKVSDVPETETATGPNFPVTYTLTVDLAPGEDFSDLVIEDLLPAGANYRGDLQILVGGVDQTVAVQNAASYAEPPVYASAIAPANTFNIPIGEALGVATTGDDSIDQGS